MSEARLTVRKGETLLLALHREGLFVRALCGGVGRCHGCSVRVDGERRSACEFREPGTYSVVRDHPVTLTPAIFPDRPTENRSLGLAVDLGTTTVGAALVDLPDGAAVSTGLTPNLQRVYGEDVLSRLAFGLEREHRGKLAELAHHTVRGLAAKLFEDSGASLFDLERITLAGNSSMTLLFLDRDPTSLAHAPFTAGLRASGEIAVSPELLGLPEGVAVRFLPAIGGHVGSDTTAAVLASGLLTGKLPALLVDLGTNGEVVLATEKGALATSSAAGPAFEGGGVSKGSPARPGAIERVHVAPGGLEVETIGWRTPLTWCGSGVVELMAVLRELGDLDPGGRLLTDRELPVPFTQGDVREVQLAKGAVAAAIRILLKVAGIEAAALRRVVLTGAFGSRVPADAARKIGLLPDVPVVETLEGGALLGAAAALTDGLAGRPAEIAAQIRHVPLGERDDFEEIFVSSMALEEMKP